MYEETSAVGWNWYPCYSSLSKNWVTLLVLQLRYWSSMKLPHSGDEPVGPAAALHLYLYTSVITNSLSPALCCSVLQAWVGAFWSPHYRLYFSKSPVFWVLMLHDDDCTKHFYFAKALQNNAASFDDYCISDNHVLQCVGYYNII